MGTAGAGTAQAGVLPTPGHRETLAWAASHLLPTARSWPTPGFRGLAAVLPAVSRPHRGEALGGTPGHEPQPARHVSQQDRMDGVLAFGEQRRAEGSWPDMPWAGG